MTDKSFFIQQLGERLREVERLAQRGEEEAREAARSMATEAEKREDSRVLLEYGSMATAQAGRVRKAQEDLQALSSFVSRGMPSFGPKDAVALGAMVEVSIGDEDGNAEERTILVMPVGAGTELTGPGGDGFLSVITPASPAGKAIMGRRAGESVDVVIRGEVREWTILEVS